MAYKLIYEATIWVDVDDDDNIVKVSLHPDVELVNTTLPDLGHLLEDEHGYDIGSEDLNKAERRINEFVRRIRLLSSTFKYED